MIIGHCCGSGKCSVSSSDPRPISAHESVVSLDPRRHLEDATEDAGRERAASVSEIGQCRGLIPRRIVVHCRVVIPLPATHTVPAYLAYPPACLTAPAWLKFSTNHGLSVEVGQFFSTRCAAPRTPTSKCASPSSWASSRRAAGCGAALRARVEAKWRAGTWPHLEP